MTSLKGETLERTTKTKEIYHYKDPDLKYDKLSKEVFLNKDEIIHYPRGFEDKPKYKTIQKFTYIGFNGKLPKGVIKSPVLGYGFTKTLNAFANLLCEDYKIQEVIIEKNCNPKIDLKTNKIYLSETNLDSLHGNFTKLYEKNKKETKNFILNTLHNLFPKEINKPITTYAANALAISLSSWGNSIDEFSEKDKEAIKDLFEKLSLKTDFLSGDALAKTKEIIDNKYIKETLKEYKTLMAAKSDTETLEKKWQKFLKEHNWIFSSIFSQPVILYKDEAYVGGKGIDNQNGKFSDFLIKNNLSDNVSFLEIKTHLTKLVESSAYRGNDVYSSSKEVSGCIVQVLNQRDNFQKDFFHLKGREKGSFESYNSKCVILIGTLNSLNVNQKYSFELFRSNSRDVEILTFDELEKKIEGLQKLMSGKGSK